jgi:dihydrodipicolinate synthase/N-acetylneuraminate lyase
MAGQAGGPHKLRGDRYGQRPAILQGLATVAMKTSDQAFAALRGLFNITVTPFHADGSFDPKALADTAERMIAFGYDGLLVGGTYGEFAVMTLEERAGLFRTAIDVVHRRVPALLCAAHSDVRVVKELTTLAVALGGIPMVTPPFVSEVTDDQIAAFFREICGVSATGVVIYNAPGVGTTLSPALIERLSDIPGIIGLKQGDLAPTVVDQLIGRLGGKIRLFCASDLQMPGPLVAGFDGLSSTNSGALPELIRAAFLAFHDGDAQRGSALHRAWYGYREFARRAGQPQTVKAAMDLRGWNGGGVRRPLVDLDEARRAELERILRPLLALASDMQDTRDASRRTPERAA